MNNRKQKPHERIRAGAGTLRSGRKLYCGNFNTERVSTSKEV